MGICDQGNPQAQPKTLPSERRVSNSLERSLSAQQCIWDDRQTAGATDKLGAVLSNSFGGWMPRVDSNHD